MYTVSVHVYSHLAADRHRGEVNLSDGKLGVLEPGDDHVLTPVKECVHGEVDREHESRQKNDQPENPLSDMK